MEEKASGSAQGLSEEDSINRSYMRLALELVNNQKKKTDHLETAKYNIDNTGYQAEKALQCNETPVGCVFVSDKEILATGFNATNESLNVSSLRLKPPNLCFLPSLYVEWALCSLLAFVGS